jgi:cytochrome c-type biogenesis protein CcmH
MVTEPAAVPTETAAVAAPPSAQPARPSPALLATLAVFVLALASIGYWLTGSFSLVRGGSAPAGTIASTDPAAAASAPTGLQQIEAMVGKLAERMKEHPDDAEGWTMLARSYTVLGRFAEAVPAYARAAELQPGNAGLLADYADAVAATHGSANNPQSLVLIERALKADPKLPKALALAGSAAYDRGSFALAIADWQKIVEQLPPGHELTPRIEAMIAEARGRLAAGDAAPTARAAADATAAAPSGALSGASSRASSAELAAAPAGKSVSGTVTLDPALAARVTPDDAVFVFARAATGSRMPLAVRRAQVKDLPLAFTLDDSMAMAPGMTLSSAPQLVVGARISKSGNAMAQPGDLAGEASGIAPGARNVAIRIGTVVGRP